MISKWKARLNGKQQLGVDFWATFAPVVNWSTSRLVLFLSLLHGFHSCQVDFVQAFIQAPLDCPIYMEIPAGFGIQDRRLAFTNEAARNNDKNALRLLKNMYDLKQAGNNWYKCLHDTLTNLNFTQSCIDKCVYIHQDCILLLYVVDCLLFSKNTEVLDTILHHLRTQINITTEDDVHAYLSLEVIKHLDGHITLRQPRLINKVISVCGLEMESNAHSIPANCILQQISPNNDPRQLTWSY